MNKLNKLLKESEKLNKKIFENLSIKLNIGDRFFYSIMECLLKVNRINFDNHSIGFLISTSTNYFKEMTYLEFEKRLKSKELMKI